MKEKTRYFLTAEFKARIEKYAQDKGESVSAITESLFTWYLANPDLIKWRRLSSANEDAICLTIDEGLLTAVRNLRTNYWHPSLRWLFVYLWTEELEK